MAETLVPGLLHRESEFVIATDPTTGQSARRFGTCGPCGAHSVASNALGHYVSTASVYGLMRQHGLCDVSGASTIDGLAQALTLLGCAIVEQVNYQEPWPGWDTFFQAHAGVHPFQFETANGQALVDYLTGLGENASNLQYHHLAVYGRHTGGVSPHAGRTLPPGYWCADGDNFAGNNDNAHNFAAANVLQFYPDIVIAAARPVGAVAVKGMATSMGVPQGWTDDQAKGVLTAPNGHTVTMGFRGAVIAHMPQWAHDNVPLEEARGLPQTEHHANLGPGTRQLFLRTILRWNNDIEGVKESDAGAELLACEAELASAQQAASAAQAAEATAVQTAKDMQAQRDALSAKLDGATTQLGADAKQIASLQQQLADALSHPAPAPDPVAQDAKAALAALKKVEGELP